MGTPAGGRKANKTLKQKLGPEGYRKHMAMIGARGGGAKVPKGLSMTRGVHARELHESRPQESKVVEHDSTD